MKPPNCYVNDIDSLDLNVEHPSDYVFAVGFWNLSDAFYNMLKAEQDAGYMRSGSLRLPQENILTALNLPI